MDLIYMLLGLVLGSFGIRSLRRSWRSVWNRRLILTRLRLPEGF